MASILQRVKVLSISSGTYPAQKTGEGCHAAEFAVGCGIPCNASTASQTSSEIPRVFHLVPKLRNHLPTASPMNLRVRVQ